MEDQTQEEQIEDVQEDTTQVECPSCAEYKAGWQRAQADYKNLQNDTAQKRSEWAKMSKWQIIEEFLPIYNNFNTAFNHKPTEGQSWDSWAQGIEFIMKQFNDALANHGVELMETIGTAFNPELHEAVGEEHSDEYDENIIIKQTEPGFTMGEKVVKPAKVIVCKKN